MALVFELSITFGSDENAAIQCCEKLNNIMRRSIDISDRSIELHAPLLSSFHTSSKTQIFEVSIVPVAIGWKVGLDQEVAHIRLNSEELSELGQKLYSILDDIEDYELALVGWDIDWINVEELREDYHEEIVDGSFSGIVIANKILDQLPTSKYFEPFGTTHVWIPYKGTKELWA